MEARFERYYPDMEAFHQQMRTDPWFVCEIVAGTNDLPQHFVYQDDRALVFLDAYPRGLWLHSGRPQGAPRTG